MKYLLDTNILIYYLNGKVNIVDIINSKDSTTLYISEITVAELLYGAEKSPVPNIKRKIKNEFVKEFQRITISSAIDTYAKEKARLKKPVKLLMILIC